MASDIRYAIRSLSRAKGFTLVTVLTLALGIGSAAAIFNVVDWILFRSSGFPTDIYNVGHTTRQGGLQNYLWEPEYRAYRDQTGVFSEIGLLSYRPVNVAIDGNPVESSTLAVSVNALSMVGIVPALGRGFLPGEDVDGRNDVVIINDDFWSREFARDPGVLGRKVTVDQQVCTIVGVLRRDQRYPPFCYSRVYRPLVYKPNPIAPWDPSVVVFGRLKPGILPGQAESLLAGAKPDLLPRFAHALDGTKPKLSTLRELGKWDRPEVYWMLVGAVGFLYAIACLNASNLMLLRMLGKRRELSVRLALGGGPWTLMRIVLMESLGVSLAACAAGILIANWLVPLFWVLAGSPSSDTHWAAWSLGWRTLAALGGLTLLTGAVIAVVPALRLLRLNIHEGLKEGGAAVGESVRLARLRGAFVVLQATFAVILLVGAGLMVRTFQRLQDVDLGFDASQRVKVRLEFPVGYVDEDGPRMALLERLQDHLRRVPGVASVTFGSDIEMAGYQIGGTQIMLADGTPLDVGLAWIPEDFAETAGIRLKRGRWMENSSKKSEVVINETLARRRYGKEDPVGQLIKMVGMPLKGPAGWTVVGVVADIRETVRSAAGSQLFLPGKWAPRTMSTFVLRMSRDPGEAIAGALRRSVYQFDPRIVTVGVNAMDKLRDQQLYYERFATSVLKVLSAIATLLTIVGLFSVLAYTVDQRMGEFGVRLALGATRGNLVALILRRAMLLAGVGIVLGIAGSMALTRYLQSLLFETPPYDPAVLALVVASLATASLAAGTLPALRAARVDVTRLLKAE